MLEFVSRRFSNVKLNFALLLETSVNLCILTLIHNHSLLLFLFAWQKVDSEDTFNQFLFACYTVYITFLQYHHTLLQSKGITKNLGYRHTILCNQCNIKFEQHAFFSVSDKRLYAYHQRKKLYQHAIMENVLLSLFFFIWLRKYKKLPKNWMPLPRNN